VKIKKQIRLMEGNYLTAGELALIDQRRGYGYDGGGYGYHKSGRGMAATGIGLAAGLGGGALLLAIAGIWGVNQASKARSRSAENLAMANQNYINQMAAFGLAERQSREAWQNVHAPSTTQYVDVQTGAGAFSGATSNALATALALNNNNGINSAIGGCNFLRVARYSAPQPCGCDTCGD
jgi:hypothetical protein